MKSGPKPAAFRKFNSTGGGYTTTTDPTIQKAQNNFFRNNRSLKAAGAVIKLTPVQVQDYARCAQDPVYFIENFVKVSTIGGKVVLFKLRPYQMEMVLAFINDRNVIVKAARQSGKSICVAAYILWYSLFSVNRVVGLLANKESKAIELLKRIQFAYKRLPLWLQQGIVEWNKGSMSLENGVELIASSTASDAIRGYTIGLLYLDEFAFIGKGKATTAPEDFWASVYPTLSADPTSKCFITSTPQGMNFFYKLWTDATNKKNDFQPILVHWSQVPGRDQAWADREQRNLGPVKFEQEHNLEFLGSAHTLIAGSKLRLLQFKTPIIDEANLKVWEKPIGRKVDPETGKVLQKEHIYVLTVDCAEGQNLDYSVIQVIDATEVPYRQVATWRSNECSPYVLPTVIHQIANEYNEAHVLIEISYVGVQVATLLHEDIGYANIIKLAPKGRMGQRVTAGYTKNINLGMKQSKATKRIGCANLKTLVEADKLLLNDMITIAELTTFVADLESFAAEPGYHDDTVMALVLFGWLSTQRYWRDATDINLRQILQKEELGGFDDEDLVPFGIIDDGIEDAMRQDGAVGWTPDGDMDQRGNMYGFDPTFRL